MCEMCLCFERVEMQLQNSVGMWTSCCLSFADFVSVFAFVFICISGNRNLYLLECVLGFVGMCRAAV